jgi:hypothetical protein
MYSTSDLVQVLLSLHNSKLLQSQSLPPLLLVTYRPRSSPTIILTSVFLPLEAVRFVSLSVLSNLRCPAPTFPNLPFRSMKPDEMRNWKKQRPHLYESFKSDKVPL